ncbi:hypothetical protein D8Y20_13160, partial [Mariprofundus sp. EBB-1]|uniref:cellulose biosynthesis cyclic di-GMP-binding regulatory protein BcsB n=1 Tax=Mariprofundus sp. EBB-1 TaxID=2650971 RepID=UPI000F2CE3B5
AKTAAEAKKLAEDKNAGEAKKLADAKIAANAKELAEATRLAEIKKQADSKHLAEAKSMGAEQKMAEDKIKRSQEVQYLKAQDREDILPLSSFLSPVRNVARLLGSNDELEAIIPISERTNVESIKLHLVFSNSLSLAKARSQLRFRFNDHMVGQVQLDPDYPEGVVDLNIPLNEIHAGYNKIRIESSLYTPHGSTSTGSELWAEIDAQQSTMSLASKTKEIDPRFSLLPGFIRGAKWNGNYPLSIMIASPQPSDTLLNAASNTVQGIAMLTDGLPLKVTTMSAQWARDPAGKGDLAQLYTPFADADGVLIGTYKELDDILGKGVIDSSIAKEQVLLKRHPIDPGSYILIITGSEESNVLNSARHFAKMKLNLADQSNVSFGELDRAVVAPQTKPGDFSVLNPMMRYNFGQLGIHNAEMKKAGDYVDLKLKMPADLFATQDNNVELNLHFSYTAGMGQGSMLTILLNGAFQRSIAIDDPKGLLIEDYRVKLPLRSFKMGSNVVRLETNIVPSEAAKNSDTLLKNIKVSFYDDSIVRVPEMNQYARLPDLMMLQKTGYPYVEHNPSLIAVAAKDDSHYSAALTLVSKFTQLQERTVPEITLTSEDTLNATQSILLIGSLDEIPTKLWDASPFTRSEGGLLFPVTDSRTLQGVPHNALTAAVGFEQVIDAFVRKVNASSDLQFLSMKGYGLLSQFESPWESGSSITLLTAFDNNELQKTAEQLVGSTVWQSLAGDVVVWNLASGVGIDNSHYMKLSDEYHTGSLSILGKVAYYAITSPVLLLLAVFMLALMLTWLTRRLIILHHDSRS